MNDLSHSFVVTATEMEQLDAWTIQRLGIPQKVLMENAGRAVARFIKNQWSAEAFIGVLFGPGNNGGDGLVVARTLSAWGYQVKAVTPFGESALGQACREQARLCEALGISTIYEISPPSSVADQVEVWVDALFGTGLKRPVEGVCQAWVEQLNEQEIPIVSLDIPSGVWGESGAVINNIAVQADHTISFQHSKWGHWAFPGADYRGRLHVRDIGIPRDAFGETQVPQRALLAASILDQIRKPLNRNIHKGRLGHLGLIGGHAGMFGAIKLAARASMRAGVGVATILTSVESFRARSSDVDTVMVKALLHCHQAAKLGRWVTYPQVSLHWLLDVVSDLMGLRLNLRYHFFSLPRVLDAGALSWLEVTDPVCLGKNCILTPHPGEAAVFSAFQSM